MVSRVFLPSRLFLFLLSFFFCCAVSAGTETGVACRDGASLLAILVTLDVRFNGCCPFLLSLFGQRFLSFLFFVACIYLLSFLFFCFCFCCLARGKNCSEGESFCRALTGVQGRGEGKCVLLEYAIFERWLKAGVDGPRIFMQISVVVNRIYLAVRIYLDVQMKRNFVFEETIATKETKKCEQRFVSSFKCRSEKL